MALRARGDLSDISILRRNESMKFIVPLEIFDNLKKHNIFVKCVGVGVNPPYPVLHCVFSDNEFIKEVSFYCHWDDVICDFHGCDGTGFSCTISKEHLLNDIDAIKKQIEGGVIPPERWLKDG